MVAKTDQARVRDLIAETITLLCKNGLHFKSQLSIQGLIGITLDQGEVFLVKIEEAVTVSENGQSAANCLLISTDVESDQDTRHTSSTTSKRHGNPKEYGYAKQLKPELKSAYSTASHTNAGSTWQHRSSQHSTMHDEKAIILTDDAEGTVNAKTACSVNESLSSQRRNQYQNETSAVQTTNTSTCMGRTGRRDINSTNLDLAKTLDSDKNIIENCTPNIIPSDQGHTNANDLYPEIKEEPNDDESAYSFHAYQDQLLSNYNVANILHNQILQPHLTTDQSVIETPSLQGHHHQLIQHELVESNTASHYQTKGGFLRRPGRGGGQSLRRRRVGGPVYRKPQNHICIICGKAFEQKRDLRGHLAAKHHMQKDHKCDICGKEFSHKRSLTDHMFVHAYKNDASMTNG